MSECTNIQVREHLPMLARGALDGAERAAVREHVAHCATCARELDMVTRAHAALRTGPADARSIDVARIADAVRRTTSMPKPRARTVPIRRAAPWALAAAAAIVLVAGGVRDRDARSDPPAAAAGFTLDAQLALASDAELEALLAELDDIPATLGTEPEAALTLDLDNGETP